ncbi:MAG: Mu transposase C-terminal domain-containing protein [Beijerinckiaceae bacterium]
MSDNSRQDERWIEARRRAAIFDRLPEPVREAAVRDAMTALGVSRATFFRLLKRYREDRRTSALTPLKPGPKASHRPFPPALAALVVRRFSDLYATRRKPSLTRFWREIAADCRQAQIPPPSIRRLRRWVDGQDQAALMQRREGRDKAEAVFLATPGGLTAERPLAIVQIDHTRVDLIVVDPVTRLPLGRPTLTLAIDVATRMALGFHLSLEPPSIVAAALCLTHAVMDKGPWLAARSIPTDWPAQGLPERILVDNGAEFRSHAFQAACHEHRIELDYRPPGTPRFGGHIERLIGTMMGAVHLIPGSTFSNITERGDLDSEAGAVMTLPELEIYLALEITGVYHARAHRALNLAPTAAWTTGSHAPRLLADPRRFLIDFLPRERRALRRDGVHLFHIRYFANALRWWLGRVGEVTVFYDPRDLSRVFLRQDNGVERGGEGEIVEARPADLTRPAIALWEHRAALKALRKEGRRSVDEGLIFATILAQRALVDQAVRRTKAARRQRVRRGAPTGWLIGEPMAPAQGSLADDCERTPLELPYYPVEEWDER